MRTRSCKANKAVLQIEKKEEEREEGNDGETSIPPNCLEEFKLMLGQKDWDFLINLLGGKKCLDTICIY